MWQSVSTSMIVPVWVSSAANPCQKKLVYTLDTQSDAAFIDQDVSHELQAEVSPVKLKLTTMMGKNTVVKRLQFSNSHQTLSCIHKGLHTRHSWKHTNLWNSQVLESLLTNHRWSSLLNCEVGLLIGYNCPRALAPRQTILGGDDEPHAVQTDLGWSIVASSEPHLETSMMSSRRSCLPW